MQQQPQPLTAEILKILTCAGAVDKATLLQLRDGGWIVTVDHGGSKRGIGREIHAARGGVRIFKSADAALSLLQESGFTGRIECVLPEPETEAA